MQNSFKKKVFDQIKTLFVLVIVFVAAVSFSSAATVFDHDTPTNVPPVGTGDYGVPLSTSEIPQYKWLDLAPDTNLFLVSQGKNSLNTNGVYDLISNQDGRYKEAIFAEKTLSYGDVLSTFNQVDVQLSPFLEANTRDSGVTTALPSWSVPLPGKFTFKDYEGTNRVDTIGAGLTASADVLELFSGDTGLTDPIDYQTNVIVLKQATAGHAIPRVTIEKVNDVDLDYDASSTPIFATLRAGILYASKALIGIHVSPQVPPVVNEFASETTDPVLMAKINSSHVLNLEGTSNIGMGDTCQLYGQQHVEDGCPDGWFMVNYKNPCYAKCRKISRVDAYPQEYGRCPALGSPDSNSYKTDIAPPNLSDLPTGYTSDQAEECGLAGGLPTGNVKVVITPSTIAGSLPSNAHWQIDGTGPIRNSGDTVSGVYVGTHSIYFTNVANYTKPTAASITVQAGLTTNVTGNASKYVVIPTQGTMSTTVNTIMTMPPSGIGAGLSVCNGSGGYATGGLLAISNNQPFYYASTSLFAPGTYIYTDASLTTPVSSSGSFYYAATSSMYPYEHAIKVGSGGILQTVNPC